MAYRVVIHDQRIVSLIQTGDGDRWLHSKAKQIEHRARVIAPRRTGRLASSHVTLPTTGTNQYAKRYRVSAQAYYARYVHEGTGGMPGRWAKLPGRNPNPVRATGKGTVIWSPKGQRANPWLARAARDVVGM